jgi:hypothetical protein
MMMPMSDAPSSELVINKQPKKPTQLDPREELMNSIRNRNTNLKKVEQVETKSELTCENAKADDWAKALREVLNKRAIVTRDDSDSEDEDPVDNEWDED